MPHKLSAEEMEAYLAEYHVGVLSVANSPGRPPHTVPVWYHYEPGGELTFFTSSQGNPSRKVALIEAAGAVTFTVQKEDLPFKYTTMEGSVVGIERPPTREQVEKIVNRYLPPEYVQGFVDHELGLPNSTLVLYRIKPDRWHGMDFA